MTDTRIEGTSRTVEVVRAVDGDTVRVRADGAEESLRLLALDTEESRAGGGKPRTPWGTEAKRRAEGLFPPGSEVTVEFPGTEPYEECLRRYRDNYGRLLVYAHVGEDDYQELTIREGYSPYFTKYGYAEFDGHDARYREAERQAQADGRGVWDQIEVNGAEMRDYDSLCAWWELRAEVVDGFRDARGAGRDDLLDSRLDYDAIDAREGERTTVFTELRSYRRVGPRHVVVDVGSQAQPFKLFLPEAVETDTGQRVLSLLDRRYVASSDGRTVERPLRNYAYVTGDVKRYRDEPEIEVTSIDQLSDRPPARQVARGRPG
jgi:micrococcal nuclease